MSFICDQCLQPAPEGVSPTFRVEETRPKTYQNVGSDPETGEPRQITSHGSEIVSEARICPTCSGVEPLRLVPPIRIRLEQPLAPPIKASLGSLVLHAMRTDDTSKRALADVKAAASILAPFQAKGGRI